MRSSVDAPSVHLPGSRGRGRDIIGTTLCVVAAGVAIDGLTDIRRGEFEALMGFFKIIIVAVPVLVTGALLVSSAISRADPAERSLRLRTDISAAVTAVAILWLIIWNYDFLQYGRPGDISGTLALNAVVVAIGLASSTLLAGLITDRRPRMMAITGGAAIVLICLGFGAPVVSQSMRTRQVRPMLEHARSHWLRIPQEATITTERTPYSRSLQGHLDRIRILTPQMEWNLEMLHSQNHWLPTGSGLVMLGYPRQQPSLRSPAEVLEYLRKHTADGSVGSVRIVTGKGGSSWFEAQSPRAGGTYRVKYRGNIELLLDNGQKIKD